MKLCFDSIEETKDFVKQLKGTRGGKDKDDDAPGAGPQTAPPPLQPPAGALGAFQPGAFTPSQQPSPGGFPGVGVTLDPNIMGLVNRIVVRIDGAIQGGQPADVILTWFRSQCGAEAAGATLDQIKQVFLPKQPLPALENIAKLMNA